MLELVGTYQKTIFRNEQNGFTVFIFDTIDEQAPRNDKGEVICIGTTQIFTKGMPLKITGLSDTQRGEPVFKVKNMQPFSDNKAITIQYLSSHRFAGIGEKTATSIVDAIGADIFSILDNDDPIKALKEAVPTIRDDRAKTTIQSLIKDVKIREVIKYIRQFGGTFDQAQKLCTLFSVAALEQLKEHPYRCGQKANLNFAMCDAIARDNGFTAYSEERIEAIAILAIKRIICNGCSYADINDINQEVQTLIQLSLYHDEIPQSLLVRALYNCSAIIIEEGTPTKFYLKRIYESEQLIVENIKRLHVGNIPLDFDNEYISTIEKINNIKYSAQQKAAFKFLMSSGVKILTGGPGTGKTTVVNGLIQAYRHFHPHETVTLCAPTGRAAARMSEVTGEPSSTIHRLLEIKPLPNGEYLCKDGSNQLNCGLLIVDEVSMVDEELFSLLMAAVKTDALVILCGDKDQLPSVGAGNVLHDLINSKSCTVISLDVTYRQNKGSCIAFNAQKVNNGQHDLLIGDDFEIITVENEMQLFEATRKLTHQYYNSHDIFATQVLSSTKKGYAGTVYLNKILQSDINSRTSEIAYGNTEYKIGDKVMFIKNNYEYDYMNGDVGFIRSNNEDGTVTVQISNDSINIPNEYLPDITLAYAATIHKSQGSEYDTVIIALPLNPTIMLQRNLIYTAITRAKKKVIIITEQNALNIAIDRFTIPTRKTMLIAKLRGCKPKPIKRRMTNDLEQ